MYLSFKNYQNILQEKVTRTEISDAFKDKHIKIGMEFEYIDNHMPEKEVVEVEDKYFQWLDDLDHLRRLVYNDYKKWKKEDGVGVHDYFKRHPKAKVPEPHKIVGEFYASKGINKDFISNIAVQFVMTGYEEKLEVLPDFPPGKYKGNPTIDNINKFLNFDDLPFASYEVKDYHGEGDAFKVDYPMWRIEPDGSLGHRGVEIISPMLPLGKAPDVMKDMFAYISRNGSTDKHCGFHSTMSIRGVNFGKKLDLLKLMLFMEENWIYKNFNDRKDYEFAQSTMEKLTDDFGAKNIDKNMAKFEKTRIKNMFKKFRKLMPENVKKNAINFSALEEDKGRIEFRWMGGTDYHKKMNEIQTTIGKYGVYLKIATDPEYRKQEYAKKLFRLINKGKK